MVGTLNELNMNKVIGLVDVDGHAKKKLWGGTIHPNIALGKISRWHKQQGDEVEWATPMKHYDKVYMSKVFNFSPDDLNVYDADEIVKGGTGYDVYSVLPEEIDRLQPDYSIYPGIRTDTAFGFLTRGCPNKCRWCVVPKKEGAIRPYMDCDEIAIEGRKKLVLMDNNILAAGDYAKQQMRKIIDRGYRVDFNQAIDARLMTEEFADLMARMKWIDRRIRFGCDTTAQVPHCEEAMRMLNEKGFHGEYFIYIMLNDDFQESYGRIDYWSYRAKQTRKLKLKQRIYPHSQPYRDPMKTVHQFPQWQKDVTHWVNNRALFNTMAFPDFEPRKGFKCGWYLEQFNYKQEF